MQLLDARRALAPPLHHGLVVTGLDSAELGLRHQGKRPLDRRERATVMP